MNVAARVPLAFNSAKSAGPIPYVGAAARDLLIQATLDFRVLRISFEDRLPLGGRVVRVAAPKLELLDESYVALLEGAHPQRDADEGSVREAVVAAGYAVRTFAAEDIAREPLATTARVIWRQRHVGVDPGMRLGLLAAFAYQATMTVDELCSRVPGPRDPVFAIMSMACAGELHLDLSQGFDRDTTVRGPR